MAIIPPPLVGVETNPVTEDFSKIIVTQTRFPRPDFADFTKLAITLEISSYR